MSYCRIGEADAYIFAHVNGGWMCCGCRLTSDDLMMHTHEEVLDHVTQHRRAGHHIPRHVDERLLREMREDEKPLRGTCGTCNTGIWWEKCPSGGWWIHDSHPDDDHDAIGPKVIEEWDIFGALTTIGFAENNQAEETGK